MWASRRNRDDVIAVRDEEGKVVCESCQDEGR